VAGGQGASPAEAPSGSARFSTTRLRPGYDKEEVDAFLEAVRDTFLGVRQPPLTAEEIRVKMFSTTRLRPGYDEEEVDAFLEEVEARLREAEEATARSEGFEPPAF
jgi:DivIVA domain-containing protein